MKQPIVIAPSILSADFARLGEEVEAVLEAGADWVHFDVMDNHYVPNLTIGPMVCKALRDYGITAPIDVHLMVEPVDRLVPDFARAGASLISFHPEASRHVDRTINLIKEEGLCLGGSSGINVAGAIRMAQEMGPGHTIVTVLCDSGTRYLSKLFNPAFLKEKDLPVPDWM